MQHIKAKTFWRREIFCPIRKFWIEEHEIKNLNLFTAAAVFCNEELKKNFFVSLNLSLNWNETIFFQKTQLTVIFQAYLQWIFLNPKNKPNNPFFSKNLWKKLLMKTKLIWTKNNQNELISRNKIQKTEN